MTSSAPLAGALLEVLVVARRPGPGGVAILALVGLASGCADPAEPPLEPVRAAPAPPPAPAAPSATPSRAPPDVPIEGEPNVEALFARVRDDLERGDDRDLVACLEPAARRAWLRDALLALEVELSVPRYEDAIARRRALGLLRDAVDAHLRPADRPARPPQLSADALGDALLSRVDAPDELLAALLSAARLVGRPLDPVRAATEGRAPGPLLGDVAPAPPAGEDGAGLGRALRRVLAGRELAEVHLVDDRGIALVRAADGGLDPIRLVRREDRVWLDES